MLKCYSNLKLCDMPIKMTLYNESTVTNNTLSISMFVEIFDFKGILGINSCLFKSFLLLIMSSISSVSFVSILSFWSFQYFFEN